MIKQLHCTLAFISLSLCFCSTVLADQLDSHETEKAPAQELDHSETVKFTPPSGWHFAESKDLPASVKIMVVGKGEKEYPPSMNLSTEPFKGTLKQYLKIVKGINDSQGAEWKNLGTIKTEAGDGNLSQVDSKTPWGDVRMMHVILVKNGTAYILTAASLKNEFSRYYKDFFKSMRSLSISENVQVNDSENLNKIEKEI